MPSIVEIIYTIAPISQYLAANDIEKKGLYGGGTDNELPRKLYMIRKNCEWMYNLDPTNETLTATTNYLYALCGKYSLAAQFITGTGGSVASTSGLTPIISPIKVVSANFVDATNWEGANSINQAILSPYILQVFWDDAQIFLEKDEQWERTATGINILEAGFDAITNDYTFYIFISRP